MPPFGCMCECYFNINCSYRDEWVAKFDNTACSGKHQTSGETNGEIAPKQTTSKHTALFVQ